MKKEEGKAQPNKREGEREREREKKSFVRKTHFIRRASAKHFKVFYKMF